MKNKYIAKCPECSKPMKMDYESGSWGKDYFWKCTNKNCVRLIPQYWECDDCDRIKQDCTCKVKVSK